MDKIRIVLVDDQILFIESLKTVLNAISPDIEVVGTAYNGKDALKLVNEVEPDVVLLDVRMPVMNGVDTVARMIRQNPNIKVMMLTTFDDDQDAHDALEQGAMGYMLKDIPPADLVSSIKALAAGSVQISPQIFHKLLYKGDFYENASDDEDIKNLLERLSQREKDILEKLSEGLDNRQIADRAFIAEQTVKNYIHSIYTKLNIHDRTALVRFAEKLLPYL